MPRLRRLYSTLIASSGLAAVQRWRQRRRVAILTYHAIEAEPFAQHLGFLTRAYHIVPLAQALAGLRGEIVLPDNALAITFDDGFGSFHANVFPLLQRFKAAATVFLTTGYVGSDDILWFSWVDAALDSGAAIEDSLPPSLKGLDHRRLRRPLMRYLKAAPDDERLAFVQKIRDRTKLSEKQAAEHRLLTWDQAREMEQSGLVTFGGHTRTHPILARASLAKARDEIFGSAADLQRELGTRERHFAYPNGEPEDFNEAVKMMVRDAGFACAVCAQRGVCRPGDDLYALRRIGFDGSFSVAEVAAKLTGVWRHVGQGGM
jgi:peptidoglycan/xylan/chitin deacetylase (PgdA/CDA1 family)